MRSSTIKVAASTWLRSLSSEGVPGALGSSIGTDTSMISANNRCNPSPKLARNHIMKPGGKILTATLNIQNNYYQPPVAIASGRRLFHSSPPTRIPMQDEYGVMTSDGSTYVHHEPFLLENGVHLEDAQLRYQTYGTLNEARDNVIVVCHALTGNASLDSWWGGLLGPGKAFDTDRYMIVCCNILGSCYGSTNPTSINPKTQTMYGKDFPDVSVKDTVRLQLLMLVNALKVNSVKSVIGGSFGGMQAMEYGVQAGASANSPYADQCFFSNKTQTPLVRTIIPIACGAAHTAWQIAISETQRQAIYADPMWETNPLEAKQGLSVARQIGMVSYRTPVGYAKKFGREVQQTEDDPDTGALEYGSKANWKVKSYLKYQGEKFLSRFDPITYVKMTEQMDSHDVARGRNCGGSIPETLSYVEVPALVMGIDSDVLYPLHCQENLAKQLPKGELRVIQSDDGHDGFLLEQEVVANHITNFLEQHD